ncbi:proline dehydrogenase family protein [Lacihabitans lacunae]|uniref:Proline dehydrogenase family protein n=1 Tax=Lacihabitans lacunae TaxID=1028214 RepID=A0ABV7YVG8_9BACT
MSTNKSHKALDFSNTEIAFKHYDSNRLKKTYAIFALMNLNWVVKIGTFLIKMALNLNLPVKKIIKGTIFQHFCGGEDIDDCENTMNELYHFKVGTILDYSVEGEDSEVDFDKTKEELIRTVIYSDKQEEKIPFCVFKVSGLGSVDLLEKYQKNPNSLTVAELEAFERIKARLEDLCEAANEKKVRLFFDAEETWIQDIIDELCLDMMRKYNFGDLAIIHNTYQLYRVAALGILKNHVEIAQSQGFKIGAKLVRGAYMEKERKRALSENYESPINATKQITDDEFDAAMEFCIENIDTVHFCLGTHNELSCNKCLIQMNKKGLDVDDSRIYFAQLLGMSDNISFNLAKENYNVAKYVPYGPIESVMPYLFRRAQENTAMAGQSSREFLLIKKELKRRRRK